MNREIRRRIVLVACLLAVLGMIGLGLTESIHRFGERKRTAAMATELKAYERAQAHPEQYSTLPAAERDTFIRERADHFGLPPHVPASPRTLTQACMIEAERDLAGIVHAQKAQIEQYRDEFNATAQRVRDQCYKTYAVDGRMPHEDMPQTTGH